MMVLAGWYVDPESIETRYLHTYLGVGPWQESTVGRRQQPRCYTTRAYRIRQGRCLRYMMLQGSTPLCVLHPHWPSSGLRDANHGTRLATRVPSQMSEDLSTSLRPRAVLLDRRIAQIINLTRSRNYALRRREYCA